MTDIAGAIRLARSALDQSETACIGVAEAKRDASNHRQMLEALRHEVQELKQTIKASSWWTGGIVTLGVALVGAISQIQVARIGVDATARGKVAAEQTVQRADREIEQAVRQAAIEGAREAIRQRDRQIDTLSVSR